jgi:CheY-like chemotaxis protein
MTMATILVIGAERVPGDRLRATLGREGHDVIVATSGRDGLERFRQHRPHVTLLDRHLPDLDGIEVLKAIRAREPQAAVILLTGGGTETPEDQARALGVTDCLSTGLSVEGLAGAVARVLPRPAAPGPPLQRGATESVADAPRPTSLLVVDDEAMIRTLLAQFLTRRGYRVRTAANGPEALALVEQELPQVIVLDMHMPGMNGLAVLQALRARQYRLGVIALTASPDDRLLKAVLDLGAVEVMGKPVKLDRLALAIEAGVALSAR